MTNASETNRPNSQPFFEVDRSAFVVNDRMGASADPRLREVMSVIVRHMHEAVREARISESEWMAGIQFLTEVGHTCTDWRQEFILLSDVLGVSMLVDALNHHRSATASENTVLGPFHVEEAPLLPSGANICLDGKGEPLVVRGRVVETGGAPIVGAMVDVWQANDDGFYDVQRQDEIPMWNLRGRFVSDGDGRFDFLTVRPRFYPIPADGPVGRLLGALSRHPNRAAHLHFIVAAQGFETLTTHIFDPSCPYLNEDAVFGVKRSLIADFVREEGVTPRWSVDWEFVLEAL